MSELFYYLNESPSSTLAFHVAPDLEMSLLKSVHKSNGVNSVLGLWRPLCDLQTRPRQVDLALHPSDGFVQGSLVLLDGLDVGLEYRDLWIHNLKLFFQSFAIWNKKNKKRRTASSFRPGIKYREVAWIFVKSSVHRKLLKVIISAVK